jgi:type I restriction enzyme R subunit
MEERDGEMVDIHQKTRDDFFEALTAFAGCLKVALQSANRQELYGTRPKSL